MHVLEQSTALQDLQFKRDVPSWLYVLMCRSESQQMILNGSLEQRQLSGKWLLLDQMQSIDHVTGYIL